MGIYYCQKCDNHVDDDYFPMEVLETKYGDQEICPSCAEKLLDEKEGLDCKAGIHEQAQTRDSETNINKGE